MDKAKTLKWLKEASEEATAATRRGDPTLSNRLGKEPATSYYYNNVYLLQSLTAEQWAEERPGELEGAERLRLQYEALDNAGHNAERLTEVEKGIEALRGQLAEVLEAVKDITPGKSEPPAAVNKAKGKAKADDKKEADEGESEA